LTQPYFYSNRIKPLKFYVFECILIKYQIKPYIKIKSYSKHV